MGIDYEFDENFDFTYCHNLDDFIHDKAKPNRASASMNPVQHPWLQFRDASTNDKIIFRNKLAEIQDFLVAKPKIIDWNLLARLGVRADIQRMLETTGANDRNVDMWDRIFRQNTPAHREWCLEFYSTLEVEPILITSEISRKQTIHFRLGGIQRHCTTIGFAYLTGMLTADEMRQEWIHDFMNRSHLNSNIFPDDTTFDQYWSQISGLPVYNPHLSKLSEINSKRLRIIHKMITFSYLHRGDNNKVYSDDLWLLRYFSELSPGLHVLAPYVLARHMARHKEKRLLCGHFVSMIASRLGVVDRRENDRNLSNPVQVGLMGELDFVKSKLLSVDRTRLLEDVEVPAPARRVRRRAEVASSESEDEGEEEEYHQHMGPQPYGFNDIRDELGRISSSFDQFGGQLRTLTEHQAYMIEQLRYLSSQQNRFGYTMDYYRPVWQHQMEEMYQARPSPEDRQLPVYSPPELYTPRQFQSDYSYPPFAHSGGADQQAGTSFHAGGASGSGAGGSSQAPDLYGAGLFGTQYFPGGGAPIFQPPGQDDEF